MIQGGIYDHLGGGFSRYSTDGHWQAPHFEKMLYDNALLISVLSEAYQITKKESYKIVIEQTIKFIYRELSNGKGAFYAALDADSEGVEGKYYTWSYDELISIIPAHLFERFVTYYQIQPTGNWEHTNILWTQFDFMISEYDEFKLVKEKLFAIREKRVRPTLDHKIILAWNSLMVIALCKAAAALSDETLIQKAIEAINWVEQNMYNQKENYFYHVNTNDSNKTFGFLDDYASLIQAYIHLQEITGDTAFLYKAKHWTEYVLEHFIDEEKTFFYYTAAYQNDVILRKKENYDGAQPSGNAVMSFNLLYLANQFEISIWSQQANNMVGFMRKMILQYPSSFSIWAQTFSLIALGFIELVCVGPNGQKSILPVQASFMPTKMLLFTHHLDPNLALLKGKQIADNQYFMCSNGTCSAPFSNMNVFLTTINQLNY
jgi:uncharacterized protein YyaL (SSP411 family)